MTLVSYLFLFINVEEEFYYPYSENKGADQLYNYCLKCPRPA